MKVEIDGISYVKFECEYYDERSFKKAMRDLDKIKGMVIKANRISSGLFSTGARASILVPEDKAFEWAWRGKDKLYK